MAIPVKCPNPSCGKQLSLKDELAGKTVKCEACGRTFEVPAPEVSPDAPTTPVTPGAPAARLVRKAEPADALVGAKIAHYRIQAILGEGGMGKVYKAHNTSLDKTCAIKILPQDFAKQDQANIDRFVREARSAAKVEHTNVLPVQFVGKVAEHYFIEMQYVDGGTLQGVLKERGKLEVKEAAQIIRDVAAGLQAAHERGIIHRDIKPTNVMLTSKGHVYVMDFGLAKVAEARTALTQQGSILGTPLYMSPEQAMGQAMDHRSDIYSLGVMFYQLLTGRPPYTADSPVVLLNMHQNAPVPDIHQVAPDIPLHIAEMIRKMMAKSAAERYQSCAEIVDELNGFLTTGGPTVTVSEEALRDAPDHRKSVLTRAKRGAPSRPPIGPPGAAPKRRSYMPAVLVLVLLLVLVLAAVVYLVAKGRKSSGTTTATPAPAVIASGEAAKQSHNVAQPPPAVQQEQKSPWDDAYVATAATGDRIPHPLSRKTYTITSEGKEVQVPEGMVYVPAGEFTMGHGDKPPNGPEHKVWLDGYFIGKYEVTNAEWKAFVDATWAMEAPKHWKNRTFPEGKENHPVVEVSWEDAQKYCEWISKETAGVVRIPTEAQWEKAARGPQGLIYPWGEAWSPSNCNFVGVLASKYSVRLTPDDRLPDLSGIRTAHYAELMLGNTTAVGYFPRDKSGYGCYDMGGNVTEWCADWFAEKYYTWNGANRNPQGPRENEADDCVKNGRGGKTRVMRGGDWNSAPRECQAVWRMHLWPTICNTPIGFRVVVLLPALSGAEKAQPGGGASGSAPRCPWDDAYVATAATGEKIPHPLSRKTYKQTLADGTTVDVPEGMVYVPAGEFTMGASNESKHKVYLDDYFIGKYEVTNAEWKVFTDITHFSPLPRYWKGGEIPQGKENHPVVYVSWEDVQKYCRWVSEAAGLAGQAQQGRDARLPTDAQWEKAARGEKGFTYPWGNLWNPDYCNCQGTWAAKYGLRLTADEDVPIDVWATFSKSEKYAKEICEQMGGLTMAVGSFPRGKSSYGCYDMAGNVHEWCADWYKRDYYKLKDAKKNPQGPGEEESDECDFAGIKMKARVHRGGGWASGSGMCRSGDREYRFPSSRGLQGFRIAILPQKAGKEGSGTAQLETRNARPETQQAQSAWDDMYVTTAATGERILHPLSRKTYTITSEGKEVQVPEGMVHIPAGEFTMGHGDKPSNGPEHKVWLDGYFIGKYEVTNAEWQAFCNFTGFAPLPDHWKHGRIPEGKENHPVVNVSWEDIQKYCDWVSRETGRRVTLPTEAQWEKAARGPKAFEYPWGNDWNPDCCNWQGTWAAKYGLKCNPSEGVPSDQWNAFFKTDKYTKEICAGMGGMTMPVGSFPKGKCFYGYYDMAGNAYEWCQDWFTTNYYKLKDARENPEGPAEEQAELVDISGKKYKARVVRGGAWSSNPSYCRAVYRNRGSPSYRYHNSFGFRVVASVAR